MSFYPRCTTVLSHKGCRGFDFLVCCNGLCLTSLRNCTTVCLDSCPNMSFKEAELRCIREAPPPNLTESSNCFMCCLVTGCTALHAAAAAEEGNAQIVELLLAARATVNLQDKEGLPSEMKVERRFCFFVCCNSRCLPQNLHFKVHKVLRLPRNLHFKVCKVLHMPRNLHFKVHKVLRLPRNLQFKVHKVLRLPQNLHFKAHKVLHLPRNLHSRSTKCCACHEICTSRPAKFRTCHETCFKVHKVLLLPRNLHFKVQKLLHLPQKTKK